MQHHIGAAGDIKLLSVAICHITSIFIFSVSKYEVSIFKKRGAAAPLSNKP
jgi:hypothetical protein